MIWHLMCKLQDAGFSQSKQDKCLFYQGTTVCVWYIDDSLLTRPNKRKLNKIVDQMEQTVQGGR